MVMQITRQPMDGDVDQLKKELIRIVASYPFDDAVGKHGYIGHLYHDAEYMQFLKNDEKFI